MTKDGKGQLCKAIKARLVGLLEKEITPRTLLEIEEVARCSRELLAVGEQPTAMGRRRSSQIMMSNPAIYQMGQSGVIGEEDGSMNAETFGAKYMREQIASAGVRDMTPKEVVEALVVAKQHNLTDLADKLETSLTRALEPVDRIALQEGAQ